MESWPGLTVFPPSEIMLRIILSDLRVHNTFQFEKYGASAYFFSLLSAQNEVNELYPVNSLLFVYGSSS